MFYLIGVSAKKELSNASVVFASSSAATDAVFISSINLVRGTFCNWKKCNSVMNVCLHGYKIGNDSVSK